MIREQLQASLGTAYTIERELGGGGMSRVFLATENRLGRKVVIKVLSPDLAAGVNADRFEQEIRLAARLQQANIVPLLATGDTNGLPYFTMPFVEGESLRTKLKTHETFAMAESVSILRDVARALSYAHAAGVVHRDIKPDNVLLSHGAAMVTDFGIAKALSAARAEGADTTLTQAGTSLGSPGYMSPEQVAGDPNVDHRADIYAFGCLGYELITGQPPFTASTPQRVLAAHISETPKPVASQRSGVPRELASLIMRCLEKDPARRPSSADEIIAALGDTSTSGSNVIAKPNSRWIAIAATVLVLIAGAAFAKLYRAGNADNTNKSIAVLPLTNLSGDKSNDFFGEGLAEEITGTLAKAGLHVVGRSSARALAAKGVSPVEIAKQFNVANVLQGSVQRAGDRVRISISLVSMPGEAVLWSDKYDRDMKDVFAVQDEIARAVTSELKVQLGDKKQLVRTETQDPQAHTEYLEGMYLWNRRTAAGLRKAISLFADAVRRDPKYAQAYGGMAMAYVVLPAYDDVATDDMLARARDAANRALAIDSTNVLALTALGYTETLEYRNASAHENFNRALAADSSFATAHFWRALLLLQQNRNQEALDEVNRARALEPASLVINTAVTQVLYDMRRYDEAAKSGQAVLQLDSTFQLGIVDLAKVLIEQQKFSEAIAMMMPALDIPGVSYREKVAVTAYALTRAGRISEASALMKKIESRDAEKVSERGMVAAALYTLGRRDQAVNALRDAVDGHDLWLAHYLHAAPYDGLRTDPRAKELFDRISKR
ncbi:MAG TPA: protein kinase [Gemmatimonadaceae bacterium]|nr:protein kinase [Gemmatimonadaceae bacterium]